MKAVLELNMPESYIECPLCIPDNLREAIWYGF